MRVPGARVNQEQKCSEEGNRDRSGPISEATTSAVSTPIVGITVRSTPSVACRGALQSAITRRTSRVASDLYVGVLITQALERRGDLRFTRLDLALQHVNTLQRLF